MSYPTLEQYQEALQHPGTALIDSELRQGRVRCSGMGLPLALCGGFALTYTVSVGSKRYAVRCFHKESKSLETRYTAISNRLKALHSGYFLDFAFQSQGVRIQGGIFPVVKMAWASGETLGEFLETNHGHKEALANIRRSFLALGSCLSQQRIAHGDIQTGNVMVGNNGSEMQLIDYDGMFVEELRSLGSSELGHPNFQHPSRTQARPYDPSLDRFSLISLTLALRALEDDPTVWRKTNSDIDGIVFRANDFRDPSNSRVFTSLRARPSLERDVRNFAAICEGKIQAVPSVEDFWAGRNIPQARIELRAAAVQPRQYVAARPVLDAADFSRCLKHVGDQVELVGRIAEVTESQTKYGKPYIFINFGHWRGSIVKITIWSEGLALLRNKPDKSWTGKWVSVVGLMEPPFENRRLRYTHLAITISQNNQITIIDEIEARFRLGSTSASARFGPKDTSNAEKLKHLQGFPSSPRTVSPRPPVTGNQAVLIKMKHATTVASSPTSPASPSSVPSGSGKKGLLGKLLDFLFK